MEESETMPVIFRIPRKSFYLVLIALFLCPAAALTQTSSPDVALITRLTGQATYWTKAEKKPAALKAFVKVRQGDNLKLAKDSALSLLYCADGRQETWKGPVTITVGATASAAPGGKKAAGPKVKMVPKSAAKKIAAASFLLSRASAAPGGATQPGAPGKSGAAKGMPMVCKLPPPGPSPAEAQKIIKKGEAVYQALKKKAGADDFTPELYFLGVLAKCRKYSEMNKMLDKMLQQKPGDQALKKLKTWVRCQTLCGG